MSDHGETLQRALRLQQVGEWTHAQRACESVLAVEPQNPDALLLLGVIMGSQGRMSEALLFIDRGMAVAPGHADFYNNRGVIFLRQGKYNEAKDSFCEAIARRGNFLDAYLNLARVFRDAKMIDDEIAVYDEAIKFLPASALLYRMRGQALNQIKQYGAAAEAYRRAIELQPNYAEAMNGLGVALYGLGKVEEALAQYRAAIAADARFARPHFNIGTILLERGRFEEALEFFTAASEINPGYATARFNRAVMLLLLGRFAEGWKEYQFRWAANGQKPLELRGAKWKGEDLRGKRILLCREQGIGDTLQFVRYARVLEERGATVLVEANENLRDLLAKAAGVTEVVALADLDVNFDFYTLLGDLPGLLGTELQTIPSTVPYLFADEAKPRAWKERLKGEGFRVGLVWVGSRSIANDPRVMRLEQFAPLGEISGVNFHSLQKGEAASEIATAPFPATDYTNALHDFADTAAMVANLDLVISVDTSVLHLAGAMGKPAWALLPASPDWRWLLDRSDSPWYPTMKLFRQKTAGDWAGVMREVAEELKTLTKRQR